MGGLDWLFVCVWDFPIIFCRIYRRSVSIVTVFDERLSNDDDDDDDDDDDNNDDAYDINQF